jgi:Bacterial Ig domain
MRRRITYTAVLTIAMFAAAACGSDTSTPGNTAPAGGGGPTLNITAPANGATVTSPFMLTFQSSEQLGKPDTGMDHVHVFADGKTDKYTVVPTNSFEIKDLTPGQHKIGVTLQHADHSPAGANAEITVMVAGGAQGNTAPSSAPTTDSGYGY